MMNENSSFQVDGKIPYYIVSIANVVFAVEGREVEEIIAPRNVLELSYLSNKIKGIVNVKSKIVPIIDIYQFFDILQVPNEQEKYLVVCKNKEDYYAFFVANMGRLVWVDNNVYKKETLLDRKNMKVFFEMPVEVEGESLPVLNIQSIVETIQNEISDEKI